MFGKYRGNLMNYWLFFGGAIVVAFVFLDALWTTLWSEGGAGPISDRIGSSLWGGAKRLGRRIGGRRGHMLLSLSGPTIIVVTVASWLVLMWTGMLMIFESHPEAVVNATTRAPADLTDRIWFVTFTTTTVGNGDFTPGLNFFQVLAGFCAASGMALLTLSITYAIQILSAVVEKRSFASEVMSLGDSAVDVVKTLQSAPSSALASQLSALGSRLGTVTEQHKSYPVVHYYHPTERNRSLACAVASLDEALRIYANGVDTEETEMTASIIGPMRRSVATFLDTAKETFLSSAEEAPRRPSVAELRGTEVDVARADKLEESSDDEQARRKLLVGLVDYDGWHWDDVIHAT